MTDAVSQRIKELFDSGYYCAESVLLTVAEAYGIQSDLIPKIATGSVRVFLEPQMCVEL